MAKNEYHEHLRSVPLFADLDKHELDVLASASTELRLPAGKVLMTEGRTAHEMFVVMDGTLEVTKGGEHIRRGVLRRVVRSGYGKLPGIPPALR